MTTFSRSLLRLSLLALAAPLGFLAHCRAEDLVIGSFAGPNYGDWKATGTAFTPGPALGVLLTKLEIENSPDTAVASSEIEGDRPTGTLTSPEFKIARKYIAFRIGGGDYERDTCINLLINGKVVCSATGWKSDHLAPMSRIDLETIGRATPLWRTDAPATPSLTSATPMA